MTEEEKKAYDESVRTLEQQAEEETKKLIRKAKWMVAGGVAGIFLMGAAVGAGVMAAVKAAGSAASALR